MTREQLNALYTFVIKTVRHEQLSTQMNVDLRLVQSASLDQVKAIAEMEKLFLTPAQNGVVK